MSRARSSGLALAMIIAAASDGLAHPSGAPSDGLVTPAHSPALLVWRLRGGRIVLPPGGDDSPQPVGSVLKPFLLRAFVRAHPGEEPPRIHCAGGTRCWRPSGHGELGAERALSQSCNVYFRALAERVPAAVLVDTLRSFGFSAPEPMTPDLAIGLETTAGSVAVRPSDILRGFVRLLSEPWPGNDERRVHMRAALRDSSRAGTAGGLDGLGLFAKTGTVPALDGAALATSGWVVASDDSGEAYLGLLGRGTGREAARALGDQLRGLRGKAPAETVGYLSAPNPTKMPRRTVTVRVFDLLSPRRLTATNLGASPLSTSSGFVGPRGQIGLRPGMTLGPGEWEIAAPEWSLRRRLALEGARISSAPEGTLRFVAELSRREYVRGVIAAEGPSLEGARAVELAAAVLRFLARGPRHGAVDVCDSTHCAWFVGRGPAVVWPSPRRPLLLEVQGRSSSLDETQWQAAVSASHEPGPAYWTAHCGGASLSPHAVWGDGDRTVTPCPRHARPASRRWVRQWPRAEVEKALGPVSSLSVEMQNGTWAVRLDLSTTTLSFDTLHSRLARHLGWDALPSPADRIVRTSVGFRAEGAGSGHRVGLCLGE